MIERFRRCITGEADPDVEPERRQWKLDHLDMLRGKHLVCHCAPLACHGDALVELANG